jgi:hypothetical protein
MLAVENKPVWPKIPSSRPLRLADGDYIYSRKFLRRYERIRVNEACCLAALPKLIAELVSSAASIDPRNKWRAYCRTGLHEYPGQAGGRSASGMVLP